MVALFVSAWIEIEEKGMDTYKKMQVALFVSAWIEIFKKALIEHDATVALFVSAWIEINLHMKLHTS